MAVSAALSLRAVSASASEISGFNAVKADTTALVAVGGTLPPINAAAIRRSFPSQWAQYLRETYRTAYAVEKAFGIDSKSARDWISGKRDPSGSFVAAVVARDPKAMAILGRVK